MLSTKNVGKLDNLIVDTWGRFNIDLIERILDRAEIVHMLPIDCTTDFSSMFQPVFSLVLCAAVSCPMTS